MAHSGRVSLGYLSHRCNEGRLTQALFVHAGGIQQRILDDGVVHSPAAFVEDSQDRLGTLQLPREGTTKFNFRPSDSFGIKVLHVAGIVLDLLLLNPLPNAAPEELVLEIHAP